MHEFVCVVAWVGQAAAIPVPRIGRGTVGHKSVATPPVASTSFPDVLSADNDSPSSSASGPFSSGPSSSGPSSFGPSSSGPGRRGATRVVAGAATTPASPPSVGDVQPDTSFLLKEPSVLPDAALPAQGITRAVVSLDDDHVAVPDALRSRLAPALDEIAPVASGNTTPLDPSLVPPPPTSSPNSTYTAPKRTSLAALRAARRGGPTVETAPSLATSGNQDDMRQGAVNSSLGPVLPNAVWHVDQIGTLKHVNAGVGLKSALKGATGSSPRRRRSVSFDADDEATAPIEVCTVVFTLLLFFLRLCFNVSTCAPRFLSPSLPK
jgi:hypothetical protein